MIGSNGAGKSTLIEVLAGFQQPVSGWVLVGGDSLGKLAPWERAKRSSIASSRLTGWPWMRAF